MGSRPERGHPEYAIPELLCRAHNGVRKGLQAYRPWQADMWSPAVRPVCFRLAVLLPLALAGECTYAHGACCPEWDQLLKESWCCVRILEMVQRYFPRLGWRWLEQAVAHFGCIILTSST